MYRKILLAVDGSACADLATQEAIAVAKACGADVEALHVADNVDSYFDTGSDEAARLSKAIVAYGKQTLEEAARRLADAGVPHQVRLIERAVLPASIADTIVSEADSCGADLVVLGTHGRRGVRRLVTGSVAEGVLRQARKPVLLVRSEAEE
ncbi:universal stress protein [Cupriavidus respiraculi]|uniref:Universal stress protein n=1 Tax=Cupriavidus respiraculi TaxID=195930 RepID=A0ABM8WGS3_9BURK|nr:universal stress protein [Cupriavidus respiraculi]CAG9166558.1 Putative universal stress protein [Cupriavidus respiraculi]